MPEDSHRNLLLWAIDFPPSRGGIQTLTTEIYGRLTDLIRLTVAPRADGSVREDYPSWHLERSPYPSSTGLGTLRYLRDGARRLRPAITARTLLHCNHVFAAPAAARLRRSTGLEYVVWVHGEEFAKTRYPWLLRHGLRHAAAILVNSDFTGSLARRALTGTAAPPIHKIPLGAPLGALEDPPAPRRRHAVPSVLTVARLCARDRYKGVDVALRAMAALQQRGVAVRYRVVGDGDDRGYLEQLARDLGIAPLVEFRGALSAGELRASYDECDVFLLCSREQPTPRGLGFEGFGIVFLEANARGKPVVGGRSGGIPDAIADGISGLLVDPDRPEAVADALERLLRDPQYAATLGRQGRERVRQHYNWENAASLVRRLHEELLES